MTKKIRKNKLNWIKLGKLKCSLTGATSEECAKSSKEMARLIVKNRN